MKRVVKFLATGILALSAVSVFAEDRSNVLKVYNWSDYIAEGVLDDFKSWYKEQTGELSLIHI